MLPFSVSLRSGVPIHDQVVYAVTRAIVTGQLGPGDPFPSVRALSQELGINPNTAHKIVATLVAERLLSVRAGIGTVVAERRRAAGRATLQAEDVERLVIAARRAGLSLQDLLGAVRRTWDESAPQGGTRSGSAGTSRRGPRSGGGDDERD